MVHLGVNAPGRARRGFRTSQRILLGVPERILNALPTSRLREHHPDRIVLEMAAHTECKVPEPTGPFWATKIAATTLGETAGDALSMSLGLGYLTSTGIFAMIFAVSVVAQARLRRFNRWVYWLTITATTTLGTTLADFADRDLGIGYAGGATLLATGLVATLLVWKRVEGSVAVESVSGPRAEAFYWLTIMFSQTLGTALGDWAADSAGLGYTGGALVFGAALVGLVLLAWRTTLSRPALFWAAFVLTRPLGAVLGDFLDKPIASGGLALSRVTASLVLASAMVVLLLVFKQRPAKNAH